ncbi:MAG: pilus assembly protein TadG-related protein [Gemmatimonadota bacterium]
MIRLREELRDERGVTLLIIAGSLVALLSIMALAVDYGMLTSARTEAQRVADLAAMAGAGTLIHTPDAEDRARAAAIAFAQRNEVRRSSVSLLDADVDVFLAESKVRVTVHRTRDRGNPLGTYFARVFGVNEVDISARAAAIASPAGRVNCLLPVAVADRWVEVGGNLGFDPDEGDVYYPPGDPKYVGYTADDIGQLIVLKPAQGGSSGKGGKGSNGGGSQPEGDAFEPGWWYLWYPTADRGARVIWEWILDCPDPQVSYAPGDWITDKNGNVQSVQRAFNDLIALDPSAAWDQGCKCVVNSGFEVSPRIRAVPLFDPRTYVKQGPASNFQIAAFAGVFVVPGPPGVPFGQQNTYARWMGITGFEGVTGGVGAGPLVRRVELVE